MGVHGLWELLAPVGRRVSVETLAGKKLAIDASIWMIQFMKAMRDDKGEMVRNAHLLGFFRRICKLLFLRTKPVFVFDGGTPALKRRTVIARRRQRENAQAKIRKTAEKLLLNHLKTMRLKELANDLESQSQKNDVKGKKVISDPIEVARNLLEGDDKVPRNHNQVMLDEILAASLAAEEEVNFNSNASTSHAFISAEEDSEEDEEVLLPAIQGKVDPAILAALPPSMQLDLLVQMREGLMAENRQNYQKVKKAPERFSELQIQSYLKTVAFRREIDEVRKSAAGRGIGGVQTSRIASEANREFIFSSSFTGDKQVLTSAGKENDQCQTPAPLPSSDSTNDVARLRKSNASTGSVADKPRRESDDDVETYLDEMGRVRVSRVRAMGIRMTRDLQRNLDLMREIELEKMDTNETADLAPTLDTNSVGLSGKLPNKIQLEEIVDQGDCGTQYKNQKTDDFISGIGTSIEISFEDNGDNSHVDDDGLFAGLVAEDPVMIFSPNNVHMGKQSLDSTSDCDWEEGVIENQSDVQTNVVGPQSMPTLVEKGGADETEVEWEEDFSDVIEHTSKGFLEEEANFQEAIRRSLEDIRDKKDVNALSENGNLIPTEEMANVAASSGSDYQEKNGAERKPTIETACQPHESFTEGAGIERMDGMCGTNHLKATGFLGPLLSGSVALKSADMEVLIETSSQSCQRLVAQPSVQEGGLSREVLSYQLSNTSKECEVDHEMTLSNISAEQKEAFICTNTCGGSSLHVFDSSSGETPNKILADAKKSKFEMARNNCSSKLLTTNFGLAQHLDEEEGHNEVFRDGLDSIHDFLSIHGKKHDVDTIKASLEKEMVDLSKERNDLGDEQKKLERNAESVSSEMFAECQELLQMFGLPYIIAPMEAEAQCAYMELANLVDGVVTDDSDVFLFGGRSVYKNIFDDRKYVETYFMKDIETELGLDREKLIHMTLLLGSDYTEGVSGIGIVNAIEVVNAFSETDGLKKFREWIESPDPTILGNVDMQGGSSSKKKGLKVGVNDMSFLSGNVEGVSKSDQNVLQSTDHLKQIFMNKHRNVSKNWHIPSSFPSEAVISAYSSPQVDKSTDPFSWGKPDLFVLRKLCWEKFGWGSQKADELLIPVLKEYNKHETQLRLEAFYTFNERFAKIRSRRIKKAVKGMTGDRSIDLMEESEQIFSKSRKKRQVSPSKADDENSKEAVSGIEHDVAVNENCSNDKHAANESRKWSHAKPQAETSIPLMDKEGIVTSRGSRLRGRGRGRGRGRARSVSQSSETSSEDAHSQYNDNELPVEDFDRFREVRKSTRPRKAVKYTTNDSEDGGSGKVSQGTENRADQEVCSDEMDKTDQGAESHAAMDVCKEHVGHQCIAVDATEKNQEEAVDYSVHVKPNDDSLRAGGGFCMDETKLDVKCCPLGSSQDCETVSGAETTKEYLQIGQIGGGFCMDEEEGEVERDQGKPNSSPMKAINGTDPSWSSGLPGEAEDESAISGLCEVQGGRRKGASPGQRNLGGTNVTTKVASSQKDSVQDDREASCPKSLSAMPHLQRKRKKF